ncbi:M61 family metallopeptidase [Snodgrassella alvi]|uniref:Peptidase n=1 Tax=Snodgrassella alvi TaxID=1196083 RepID=A0A2N9X9Z4_9NEIS|nr:PDZ domain-containing protein [Snodgrassella alvi]PIT42315.1 peptidase [Snodgrassella alvi]
MLNYHLQPHSLTQHLWHVRLSFTQLDNQNFTLSLPNWLPGSYMIRDFARHIVTLTASCNNSPATAEQINKNTWSCKGLAGKWEISYLVYAFDSSVRGSFLNTERGFFDGACLFLRHNQRQQEACQLIISGLPENWDIATTMPAASLPRVYQTGNYRALIDYPVEMGYLLRLPFTAAGIEHEIVISGHFSQFDQQRLVQDVARICACEIAMFDAPPPFERYSFLLHVGNGIYGGLEHRSSSALMADRHDLPQTNGKNSEAYITLLGLFSHEYFHAWNVKSIIPAAFANNELNTEAYTHLLWAFEGITSYYDDLFLVRSGVITPAQYLHLLAKTITRVQQGAGRLKQTLAESSLTAWTKYYKQNENSANAIVSYYQKGALAAMCLDHHIRQHTNQQKNLDDVMRALYQDWRQRGLGLAENEWLKIARETTGIDLTQVYQQYIMTTSDLPMAEKLHQTGVSLHWAALPLQHGGAYIEEPTASEQTCADLGARFKPATLGITLQQVFNQGSAENAGLSAGDQLIALNDEIITDFSTQWARIHIGETVRIHFIRDGLLRQSSLLAQPAINDTALLSIENTQLLQQWLQPQPRK